MQLFVIYEQVGFVFRSPLRVNRCWGFGVTKNFRSNWFSRRLRIQKTTDQQEIPGKKIFLDTKVKCLE